MVPICMKFCVYTTALNRYNARKRFVPAKSSYVIKDVMCTKFRVCTTALNRYNARKRLVPAKDIETYLNYLLEIVRPCTYSKVLSI